ncbi:hypothetical protein H310_11378 [Aphanomyces invadans]|uniref:CHK kinase-like domain-containing protein n=1 Tax=Aphanomyces invadans TaxID=157072 RepID=A0A024TLQ2_9STRA|nr:hypothetical protein H310_11378 [Aphanomyces invadans]ETV95095.1 hypothetical protein H310_11378 [Aphanomyces invadans]|eukprot:XP_008876268.1 hypothetical protein H310_11378 [Aphanomyces invadans]
MGRKHPACSTANASNLVADTVTDAFPDDSVVGKTELCSLWAGYGSIYRVRLSSGVSVIVKHISPPQNDTLSVSNARKVRSYQVEGYFYGHLSAASTLPRLPRTHAVVCEDGSFCFVLEDLSVDFPKTFHSLGGPTLRAALSWLARFHAAFWNYSDDGVADNGGYWYLATRQEEFEALGNDELSVKLRAQAASIDQRCRDPRFETLLHGDAKSANMLWRDDTTCAWVDFQYVGRGLGAKDVAYLLCSSGGRSEVANYADDLLRWYFDEFEGAMASNGRNSGGYTCDLFRSHFDWCLLDYVRFMAGWGFWGNYDWAIRRTKPLLA